MPDNGTSNIGNRKDYCGGRDNGEGHIQGHCHAHGPGGVDKISYLTVTSGIDKYCTFNTYATDRGLQKGEYVLVDISGHIDGYASDLTRVFYLGTVPMGGTEMANDGQRLWRRVKEAMKPGVSIAEINRICEGYISGIPGFGKFLLQFSGHCIGPQRGGVSHSYTMKPMKTEARHGVLPWKTECIPMT